MTNSLHLKEVQPKTAVPLFFIFPLLEKVSVFVGGYYPYTT